MRVLPARVLPARNAPIRESGGAWTPRFSPFVAAAALVVVLLLAGTLGLWAHYGTAVFYEMVVAGLAACL